jgi:hypothetical protein
VFISENGNSSQHWDFGGRSKLLDRFLKLQFHLSWVMVWHQDFSIITGVLVYWSIITQLFFSSEVEDDILVQLADFARFITTGTRNVSSYSLQNRKGSWRGWEKRPSSSWRQMEGELKIERGGSWRHMENFLASLSTHFLWGAHQQRPTSSRFRSSECPQECKYSHG